MLPSLICVTMNAKKL